MEKIFFKNESDYYRGIHNLFEFNDRDPVIWKFRKSFFENSDPAGRNIRNNDTVIKEENRKKRKFLVEILCFCLMPNHIHLLLMQVKDGGITKFMRKFGTGYAVHFNNKYKRKGYLFQGRFKDILIKTNEQLRINFVYIHTNPAALHDHSWKDGGINNAQEVIKVIENYKWSSYADYLGNKNFPSVTQRDLFNKIMTSHEWKKFVDDWVGYKKFKLIDSEME
ncbi:transposase [Candidatus Azambacteria bacterium]|nr:transposase [Candidatus Azambacteria bacterium]